jgi:hypothetical protein
MPGPQRDAVDLGAARVAGRLGEDVALDRAHAESLPLVINLAPDHLQDERVLVGEVVAEQRGVAG